MKSTSNKYLLTVRLFFSKKNHSPLPPIEQYYLLIKVRLLMPKQTFWSHFMFLNIFHYKFSQNFLKSILYFFNKVLSQKKRKNNVNTAKAIYYDKVYADGVSILWKSNIFWNRYYISQFKVLLVNKYSWILINQIMG